MSDDPFLDLTRSLAAERRQPVQQEEVARESQQIADLRQVIHLLAQMMQEARRAA